MVEYTILMIFSTKCQRGDIFHAPVTNVILDTLIALCTVLLCKELYGELC